MKKIVIAFAFLLSAILSVGPSSPSMATDNPLKEEMRLLDDAFKNLMDALILNKPGIIEEPFHAVHKAKEKTEAALHSGKVKLPKNHEKLEDFVEMDEAFHEKLKKLIGASRKRDMEKIKTITHDILDQCVECHEAYKGK